MQNEVNVNYFIKISANFQYQIEVRFPKISKTKEEIKGLWTGEKQLYVISYARKHLAHMSLMGLLETFLLNGAAKGCSQHKNPQFTRNVKKRPLLALLDQSVTLVIH